MVKHKEYRSHPRQPMGAEIEINLAVPPSLGLPKAAFLAVTHLLLMAFCQNTKYRRRRTDHHTFWLRTMPLIRHQMILSCPRAPRSYQTGDLFLARKCPSRLARRRWHACLASRVDKRADLLPDTLTLGDVVEKLRGSIGEC